METKAIAIKIPLTEYSAKSGVEVSITFDIHGEVLHLSTEFEGMPEALVSQVVSTCHGTKAAYSLLSETAMLPYRLKAMAALPTAFLEASILDYGANMDDGRRAVMAYLVQLAEATLELRKACWGKHDLSANHAYRKAGLGEEMPLLAMAFANKYLYREQTAYDAASEKAKTPDQRRIFRIAGNQGQIQLAFCSTLTSAYFMEQQNHRIFTPVPLQYGADVAPANHQYLGGILQALLYLADSAVPESIVLTSADTFQELYLLLSTTLNGLATFLTYAESAEIKAGNPIPAYMEFRDNVVRHLIALYEANPKAAFMTLPHDTMPRQPYRLIKQFLRLLTDSVLPMGLLPLSPSLREAAAMVAVKIANYQISRTKSLPPDELASRISPSQETAYAAIAAAEPLYPNSLLHVEWPISHVIETFDKIHLKLKNSPHKVDSYKKLVKMYGAVIKMQGNKEALAALEKVKTAIKNIYQQ